MPSRKPRNNDPRWEVRGERSPLDLLEATWLKAMLQRQVSSRACAQKHTVALFSRLSAIVVCAGTERIVFSIRSRFLDRKGISIEMHGDLQPPG